MNLCDIKYCMFLCMVKYRGMLQLLGIVSNCGPYTLYITMESQIIPIGLITSLTPIYIISCISDLLSLVAHLIFFAIPGKGKFILGGEPSGTKFQG